MSVSALARPDVSLDDKFTAREGPVMMSGIQTLVRIALDQRRLDVERGLRTGMFITGYQGSPLGGVDREMLRARRHLDPAGVVFRAAVNEELAATAVGGTQLLGALDRRRLDGVTGIWFGKNPGLDRAADGIRHSNVSGTAPLGGAVAWIGDDPASKSSTIPSASEPMSRSLMMPLLAPGSVQELHSLGLHGIALSRHAGLWTGLKIVADVADAAADVDIAAARDEIPFLPARERFTPARLLPPTNLDAEHELMTVRLARAIEYAKATRLNRVVFQPPRAPRLTILAAGMAMQAVWRALEELGLDQAALACLEIRLVQLRMPWPLDRDELRDLTAGSATVMVVEDKLEFIETLVRDALYGHSAAPPVIGKLDADGKPLLSARGALDADAVAVALGRVLGPESLPEPAQARLSALAHRVESALPTLPVRTPYFCSGCPHNSSTRAQPDQLVGVGIGCHIMIALDEGDRRGQLVGMPQMGGEGAQWIGLAPFTDDEHFTQNIGDGTFHHSGSLALRASVAAEVNVTYRLLYNDAVAMTGGQHPQGRIPIPELTRWLALEGVRRIIITTPEPDRYRGVALSPIASVRHRDALQESARELAGVAGVTVLIHDDECATEKRRRRKRGELKAPPQSVVINERVCEGCGDCGEKSTCLSVRPVETSFGRKTQIHQSSCNQDLTCLQGDCPSFLVVTPVEGAKAAKPPAPGPPAVPAPVAAVPSDVLIRLLGIGGTGVVTISAILQMAAHIDGRHVAGLEQIGLAQKGGPVLSDLRISSTPIQGLIRASSRSVDVLLGFDALGAAAAPTLAVADRHRTIAVLDTSQTPTAQMVTDSRLSAPSADRLLSRVAARTRALHAVDAEALAERLFGDHLPANMLLVGAAFQHGCVPISLEAIETAITLNGAAVASNLAAFRWGRAVAADPLAVELLLSPQPAAAPEPDVRASAILAQAGPELSSGPLASLVQHRIAELTAYQDAHYARTYLEHVAAVARREQAALGRPPAAITEAYAVGLHKLMAYKDEYEVARLHLLESERQRVRDQFGAQAKVQILLHPPALRALGLKRKVRFGRTAEPMLRGLTAARRLRGTRADLFGYARVRGVERALITEYERLVDRALDHLTPRTADQVAAIAALPDLIRGYEHIKLRSIESFRDQAGTAMKTLTSSHLTSSAGSLELRAVTTPAAADTKG